MNEPSKFYYLFGPNDSSMRRAERWNFPSGEVGIKLQPDNRNRIESELNKEK
jgi:hypothetical protein